MPRNVEIKARLTDLQAVHRRVQAIADDGPVELAQDDTFFQCETGRLKLRQLGASEGNLIFYRRADQAGPRESFFVLHPTADPAGLRDVLALAYGTAGRVIKQRTLFHIGRTRIHLDRVQGLGDFLELEVMLSEDETVEAGTDEARRIMALLGISASQLIETAYVDLMPQ